MPIGTPFHERTLASCDSLSYREWSGYYTVSAYETHHEHEYSAIRNAAALIDVSPLFKYLVSGPDATSLVDRVITRDARKMSIGQVFYTPWCTAEGHVIDDGTVSRLGENLYRWTAADPTLRWLQMNSRGLDVELRDVSTELGALAVQGPRSAALLMDVADADVAGLKYFRVISGTIAGAPVDISRTGYTGDLGYEIWVPADRALTVWDAITDAARRHGGRPAGMLALDMARIEAGLLLLDVDYVSCRKAMIDEQLYTPHEMGLGRLVSLSKAPYVGQGRLAEEARRGPRRQVVGLEFEWEAFERLHEAIGLPPEVPAAASRVAVPVYADGQQVGKATSTTWSPTLKKLIALATIARGWTAPGSRVEVEVTIEAVRHRVPATVVQTPFFNPKRKTASPAS